MRSRALRRHHRDRIWRKRRHYYGGANSEHCWRETDPRKRMVINTPALCSTCCSKNYERRLFGVVTRKEKLAAVSEQEQLLAWKEPPIEAQSSATRFDTPRVASA